MGLHKTLMGYSDQMWENSIKMIKYMTKRGAKFDGSRINTFTLKSVQPNDFDGEVEALAISLDMWKRQAVDVRDRIKQAMHKHNDSHFDPSVRNKPKLGATLLHSIYVKMNTSYHRCPRVRN